MYTDTCYWKFLKFQAKALPFQKELTRHALLEKELKLWGLSNNALLLQRNLKIMIDSGDSAKRENDTRFQSIKNEVIETLKTQVPLMEPQVLSPLFYSTSFTDLIFKMDFLSGV